MKLLVELQKQLKPLDGKHFESYQELEDAVFPYYGKLSAYYTGEGHRSLVDKLLQAGWAYKNNDDSYDFVIPEINFDQPMTQKSPKLSNKDVFNLSKLYFSGPIETVDTDYYLNKYRGLIDVGFVECDANQKITKQILELEEKINEELLNKNYDAVGVLAGKLQSLKTLPIAINSSTLLSISKSGIIFLESLNN